MMYHNPVLLNESIDGLNIMPGGTYVDVTFGGGGHSNMILSKLDKGRLFAFDQDKDAASNVVDHLGFKFINANFRYIKKFLRIEGVKKIDGLLADLGVSSYQFDIADRGFSTRLDGQLDMRMNVRSNISAKDIINDYSEEDLVHLFYEYGDLKGSRKIAEKIVEKRKTKSINTTSELKDLISDLVAERYRNKFLAKVFQAIRIEVNDEITSLKEMLSSALDLLNPSGRLVVISYHSLEDRLVKNLVKRGSFDGILAKDFFGNPITRLKAINKKVIVPSHIEIEKNSRARSAKLRIAEKLRE